MEKSIIIIGKQGQGKTKKAIELTEKFNKEEVLFTRYNRKLDLKKLCNKTKIIVVDGISDIEKLKKLIKDIKSQKIIAVIQSDMSMEQKDYFIKKSFTIINLDNN